ncbi:hypothetical protein L7F22_045473 [Adiantum nelumboides]|nr:hypothetical protein [Adiantum nelumboides]
MVWKMSFMLAKGVRFNAEKKQEAKKHEKPAEMPKAAKPILRIVNMSSSGCKSKDYDPKDAETLMLTSDAYKGKFTDLFYRLEHLGDSSEKLQLIAKRRRMDVTTVLGGDKKLQLEEKTQVKCI